MKLPKKVKAKWLKALRSGEYKQAKGTLHDPETGGFCCLGVLEHVCMNGEVEADDNGFFVTPSKKFYDYIGAEVNTIADIYIVDRHTTILTGMNDGLESHLCEKRKPSRKFTTIANWIEKNIETTD
jgi:hypothetical protein